MNQKIFKKFLVKEENETGQTPEQIPDYQKNNPDYNPNSSEILDQPFDVAHGVVTLTKVVSPIIPPDGPEKNRPLFNYELDRWSEVPYTNTRIYLNDVDDSRYGKDDPHRQRISQYFSEKHNFIKFLLHPGHTTETLEEHFNDMMGYADTHANMSQTDKFSNKRSVLGYTLGNPNKHAVKPLIDKLMKFAVQKNSNNEQQSSDSGLFGTTLTKAMNEFTSDDILDSIVHSPHARAEHIQQIEGIIKQNTKEYRKTTASLKYIFGDPFLMAKIYHSSTEHSDPERKEITDWYPWMRGNVHGLKRIPSSERPLSSKERYPDWYISPQRMTTPSLISAGSVRLPMTNENKIFEGNMIESSESGLPPFEGNENDFYKMMKEELRKYKERSYKIDEMDSELDSVSRYWAHIENDERFHDDVHRHFARPGVGEGHRILALKEILPDVPTLARSPRISMHELTMAEIFGSLEHGSRAFQPVRKELQMRRIGERHEQKYGEQDEPANESNELKSFKDYLIEGSGKYLFGINHTDKGAGPEIEKLARLLGYKIAEGGSHIKVIHAQTGNLVTVISRGSGSNPGRNRMALNDIARHQVEVGGLKSSMTMKDVKKEMIRNPNASGLAGVSQDSSDEQESTEPETENEGAEDENI